MNKKTILLCLSFLLAHNVLLAQHEWTMKECMQYAVEHAAEAKIKQAENQKAEADYTVAAWAFVPQISADVKAITNFGRSIDPETNTYGNYTNLNNNYSISAGYTLFDGFSAVNNLKIAQTAKEMGVLDLQQINDNICLEVIQAYYNVLYYSKMSELATSQLEASKNNLILTARQVELGVKSQSDLAGFEADVAAKEFNQVKMQNATDNALLVLKKVMFFPIGDTLRVTTVIELDLQQNIDNEDAKQIFESAQLTFPCLLIAQNQLEIARLNFQTSRWRLLPSLSAYAGYSTGYIYGFDRQEVYIPFFTQMKNLQGAFAQINLSIPLFVGMQRQSTIQKNKNNMQIAQYQLEQQKQEVEVEIELAVQNKEGALREFEQAHKQAKAQHIAHQLNEKKYEQGLISVLELQTSSNLYLNAEAEKLNAFFQYNIKRCVVNYYKGIPYLNQ